MEGTVHEKGVGGKIIMSSLKEYASRKIRRDTAANWALNNPIPLQGEWCLETDTGNVKIGDGSTVWNGLGYRQQLPFTYSLSSNKTHTLPAITGAPQTESVYWTGGGIYKLTIEKDDGTPLDYEGEGNGHILVESDGSNWQVREYEDSGTSSTQTFKKFRDGRMQQTVYLATFAIGASTELDVIYDFKKSFVTVTGYGISGYGRPESTWEGFKLDAVFFDSIFPLNRGGIHWGNGSTAQNILESGVVAWGTWK